MSKVSEKKIAIFLIVLGIIEVFVFVPKNSYFFMNFAYIWLPQALVIGVLLLFKMRMSIVSGAQFIMILLVGYYTIIIADSLAWIGYLFTIVGSLFGSLLFGFITKKYDIQSGLLMGIGSVISTFICVGLIQVVLCFSVMYCGFTF